MLDVMLDVCWMYVGCMLDVPSVKLSSLLLFQCPKCETVVTFTVPTQSVIRFRIGSLGINSLLFNSTSRGPLFRRSCFFVAIAFVCTCARVSVLSVRALQSLHNLPHALPAPPYGRAFRLSRDLRANSGDVRSAVRRRRGRPPD